MLQPSAFYEACNLVGNPFRSNPTFAADPRSTIWVGYDTQRDYLVKYLSRSRSDQIGNANFVMIYGTYGTGKSHALLWAQNLILHSQKDEFNSVCYFIPTLKKDKGKLTLAGAFLEDLVAKSSLLEDIREYVSFLRTKTYQFRDENSIATAVNDEAVIERMIPPVELSNFAKELFKRPNLDELKQFIAPKGLNDYQAMTVLTRLINLFVHEIQFTAGGKRFKKACYLFIDELDDLLRATVKEAREINDLLRHIYDSCPNCFCLVIALSAASAELPAIFEDYVLSRIQRQIILQLLDKDDAVAFVGQVLERSRLNSKGPSGLFPFEKQAIDAICSHLVEITPRKVVNVMQQVIEEVRLAGYDPKSKAKIGLNELDKWEIVDSVLGEGGIT